MKEYIDIFVLEIAHPEVTRAYLAARDLPADFFEEIEQQAPPDLIGELLADSRLLLYAIRSSLPGRAVAPVLVRKLAEGMVALGQNENGTLVRHPFERNFFLGLATAMGPFGDQDQGMQQLLKEAQVALCRCQVKLDDINYGDGFFSALAASIQPSK